MEVSPLFKEYAFRRLIGVLTGPECRYGYFITDHLGSTRLVYCDLDASGGISSSEIRAEYHYYSFVLQMNGPWTVRNTNVYREKYQYSGIEYVQDHDIDLNFTTFRTLDASLGRWLGVDPRTELMMEYTPYGAMNNNPISYSDPDGDLAWFIPVIAGAVDGLGNVADNSSKGNIKNWGDGLKAFSIGAGAAVGATFAAVPAATALAGSAGVSLTLFTSAAVGGVSAGIQKIARNIGNAAVFGDVTWGEALGNIGLGIVTGATVGGVYQGLINAYGFDPFSGDF